MNQEKRTLVIQDDPTRGDGVTVKGMRIRRCNGCVKCITMNPGRCALEDDFSPVIAQLASHDTVRFVSKVDGNTFPGAVTKAVERISNILQAYTELGGNTPLDTEGVRLTSRPPTAERSSSSLTRPTVCSVTWTGVPYLPSWN